MTKKLGLYFIAIFACLMFCAGTSFAADGTQVTSGFLNNRPADAFNFSSTIRTSAVASVSRESFNPADFSLPEASLDRLNNDNLGTWLQTDAAPEVKPKSPKKKVGRIMSIAGLGAALVGTVMVVAAPEKPNDIGDSGMGINWRATGFAWIGVGLGVAIAGLILGSSK